MIHAISAGAGGVSNFGCAFTPDGRFGVLCPMSQTPTVFLVDLSTGEFAAKILIDPQYTTNGVIDLSNDGNRLLVNLLSAIAVVDLEQKSVSRIFANVTQHAYIHLVFAGNDQFAAVGDMLGRIGIWNIATGQRITSFEAHPGAWCYGLAASQDGRLLLSGPAGSFPVVDQGDATDHLKLRLWRLPDRLWPQRE